MSERGQGSVYFVPSKGNWVVNYRGYFLGEFPDWLKDMAEACRIEAYETLRDPIDVDQWAALKDKYKALRREAKQRRADVKGEVIPAAVLEAEQPVKVEAGPSMDDVRPVDRTETPGELSQLVDTAVLFSSEYKKAKEAYRDAEKWVELCRQTAFDAWRDVEHHIQKIRESADGTGGGV